MWTRNLKNKVKLLTWERLRPPLWRWKPLETYPHTPHGCSNESKRDDYRLNYGVPIEIFFREWMTPREGLIGGPESRFWIKSDDISWHFLSQTSATPQTGVITPIRTSTTTYSPPQSLYSPPQPLYSPPQPLFVATITFSSPQSLFIGYNTRFFLKSPSKSVFLKTHSKTPHE